MKGPVFSIIAPDYEGAVGQYRRQRFLESVLRQSFPLWELLLIHDGPRRSKLDPLPKDERIQSLETEERYNDFGHSLRRLGLQRAAGRYILHCNADNVLFEHCLAILYAYSLRPRQKLVKSQGDGDSPPFVFNPEVLIFAVRMMGKASIAQRSIGLRIRALEMSQSMLLSGAPPVHRSIDCMQLVATKRIYDAIGGWYDTSRESDGAIFERIGREHGYLMVPDVLGEHW
jgi:hypothetical protein